MPRKVIKLISFLLCVCLLFQQTGFAQVAGQLDISGHILSLRNSFIQDKFRPLHLRYLSYDNQANNFKLLLDKGDSEKGLSPKGTVPEEKLKEETKTLLNYFFVGVSLPNDSFWVNLRPDSEHEVIDPELGRTDVGKILLEADLQLKQDTAQFTSPETFEGKKYWDKLYKKAEELFGYENITLPTLTRPWIVPDEIIIRETQDNAYIYKATLKVLLEQDYLKDSSTYNFKDPRLKALNEYSSQLIRELIIPKLTKEINTSKRYAPLRQVYYSLILAQWFKQRFYGRGGLYSWLIDKKNLTGLTSKTPWSKTTYFQAYQKSFKEGEYNLKEPTYTPYGQTIRSYMSGGIALEGISGAITRGFFNAKRNILESHLAKKLKYIIVLSVLGGTLNNPFNLDVKAAQEINPPVQEEQVEIDKDVKKKVEHMLFIYDTEGLVELGKKVDIVPYLIEALNNKDFDVCLIAAKALGKLRDSRAVVSLIKIMGNKDLRNRGWDICLAAIHALGEINDPQAFEPLLNTLRDTNSHRHADIYGRAIVDALVNIGISYSEGKPVIKNEFIPLLIKYLRLPSDLNIDTDALQNFLVNIIYRLDEIERGTLKAKDILLIYSKNKEMGREVEKINPPAQDNAPKATVQQEERVEADKEAEKKVKEVFESLKKEVKKETGEEIFLDPQTLGRYVGYLRSDFQGNYKTLARFMREKEKEYRKLLSHQRDPAPLQIEAIKNAEEIVKDYLHTLGLPYKSIRIVFVPGDHLASKHKIVFGGGLYLPLYHTVVFDVSLNAESLLGFFVHEILHANSFVHQPRILSEGMTEYIKIVLLMSKEGQPDFSPRAVFRYSTISSQKLQEKGLSSSFIYQAELVAIAHLVEKIGMEPVLKAYFEGDYSQIKQALGEEAWRKIEDLVRQFGSKGKLVTEGYVKGILKILEEVKGKYKEGGQGQAAPAGDFEQAWNKGVSVKISSDHLRVLQDPAMGPDFVAPQLRLVSREATDSVARGKNVIRLGNRIMVVDTYWNALSEQEKLDVLMHEAMADWLEQKGVDAGDVAIDIEGLKVDEAKRRARHTAGVDRSMEGEGFAKLRLQLKEVISDKESKEIYGAIADAHGSRKFIEWLKEILNRADKVVFTGDMMDRGDSNMAVYEALKEPVAQGKLIPLWGNHDLMFVLAMLGDDKATETWLINGGNNVLDELGLEQSAVSQIRSNSKLREIANWMIDNFHLYYIDPRGTLYLHAGIPLDGKGNINLEYKGYKGLLALALIEQEMKDALAKKDLDASVWQALQYTEKLLWTRNWINIAQYLAGGEKIASELGVARIVFGHTRQDQTLNIDNRIFGIDRKMYGDEGGIFVNGEGKITLHTVKSGERNIPFLPLSENAKQKIREIIKAIEEQGGRLNKQPATPEIKEPGKQEQGQPTQKIIKSNVDKIFSSEFMNVLYGESIGGNAGEYHAGVNGVMNKYGEIVEFKNPQNLSKEVSEAFERGELFSFCIRVNMKELFGKIISKNELKYEVYIDDMTFYGAKTPEQAKRILEESVNLANQKAKEDRNKKEARPWLLSKETKEIPYVKPIKLTLSPNTEGSLTLWIYKFEDIPDRWPVKYKINPDIRYFIIKEDGPADEYKALRDDEEVILGRYNPGRFEGFGSGFISRSHLKISRKKDTIVIEDTSTHGTLLEGAEGVITRQPPQPRFGHSGNAVDTQILKAKDEIQKADFNLALGHIKEAIRLLKEEADKLDDSGFPVADRVNQQEIAVWVLEQLKANGIISDNEAQELLQQLKIDKNNPPPPADAEKESSPTVNTSSASSPLGEQKTASSPSIPQDEQGKGGIDFRGLPIVTQPAPLGTVPLGRGPFSSGGDSPYNRGGTVPVSLNLDKEWSEIERMLNAGIIPSSQRIKEYLIASCQNGDFNQEIDKVLSVIADILRIEEERCCATESSLRDILVLLESDKPAQELQVGLSKIEILAKEPALIK